MAKKLKLFSDTSVRVWASPAAFCVIPYKGHVFWSAEQLFRYFQSKSEEYRQEVANAFSLKQLLYIASDRMFNDKGWKRDPKFDKADVMLKVTLLKYKYNPVLAQLLVDTGNAKLSYDASYDDFFGVGRNGTGEDRYGSILERVRKRLLTGKLVPIAFKLPTKEWRELNIATKGSDKEEPDAKPKPGRNRSPDYDKEEPRRKNTGKLRASKDPVVKKALADTRKESRKLAKKLIDEAPRRADRSVEKVLGIKKKKTRA